MPKRRIFLRQGNGILGIRLKKTSGAVPTGILSNAVGGWEPDNFAGCIEWASQVRNER